MSTIRKQKTLSHTNMPINAKNPSIGSIPHNTQFVQAPNYVWLYVIND